MTPAEIIARRGLAIAEAAWAAGFFDGEGSVMVRRTARHKGGTTGKMYPLLTVEVQIAQVRPEPLHRFHQVVQVGKLGGPYQPRTVGHSAYFKWNTAGRPSALAVARALWPFLSPPKREQFQRCWAELERLRTPKSPKLEALPT